MRRVGVPCSKRGVVIGFPEPALPGGIISGWQWVGCAVAFQPGHGAGIGQVADQLRGAVRPHGPSCLQGEQPGAEADRRGAGRNVAQMSS